MASLIIDAILYVVDFISQDIIAGSAVRAVDETATEAFIDVANSVEGKITSGATIAGIGGIVANEAGNSGKTIMGPFTNHTFPSIINDGTNNVVYEPDAAPVRTQVYMPFEKSTGTRNPLTGENAGGYGGVWFNPSRKKKNKKYL